MTRISIVLGLGLALALAACGGRDDANQAAKSTEVTVQSADQPGDEQGANTEVTVESAEPEQKPAKE